MRLSVLVLLIGIFTGVALIVFGYVYTYTSAAGVDSWDSFWRFYAAGGLGSRLVFFGWIAIGAGVGLFFLIFFAFGMYLPKTKRITRR